MKPTNPILFFLLFCLGCAVLSPKHKRQQQAAERTAFVADSLQKAKADSVHKANTLPDSILNSKNFKDNFQFFKEVPPELSKVFPNTSFSFHNKQRLTQVRYNNKSYLVNYDFSELMKIIDHSNLTPEDLLRAYIVAIEYPVSIKYEFVSYEKVEYYSRNKEFYNYKLHLMVAYIKDYAICGAESGVLSPVTYYAWIDEGKLKRVQRQRGVCVDVSGDDIKY